MVDIAAAIPYIEFGENGLHSLLQATKILIHEQLRNYSSIILRRFNPGIRFTIALPKFIAVAAPVIPPPKTKVVARNRLPAMTAGALNGPAAATAATVPATPTTVPTVPTIPTTLFFLDEAVSSFFLLIIKIAEYFSIIDCVSSFLISATIERCRSFRNIALTSNYSTK